MKYAKVLWIEWIDSTSEVGWESLESVQDEIGLTISVGIQIAETKDAVVIANSYDQETNESNGRISIPYCAIKKAKTLCQIQLKTKTK